MELRAPEVAHASVDRSRSPSPIPSRSSSTPNDTRMPRDGARWSERERERKNSTQPSRDVILLGLDPDVDGDKLRQLVTALADMVQARLAPPPQDVTVIRDRNTGASKGFGFVKFDTLEDAKRFVLTHAPFIHNSEQWLGPAPNPNMRRKRIKIDFSNSERPQGGISYYEQHNAPNSKEQLKRARARRSKSGSEEPEADEVIDTDNENAGIRDASAGPTDMLLLTLVRKDVTTKEMGQALMDVTQSLEQVLLLRDRESRASTGKVLAVYRNVDAAKAALAILRNRATLPLGILGQPNVEPVKTSFADPVVLEEADPYDPTSAPWVFVDQKEKTWRYEDESLGFDVWTKDDMSTETSRRSSVTSVDTPTSSTVSLPLPAVAPATTMAPVMSNGTTYFIQSTVTKSAPMPTAPAPPATAAAAAAAEAMGPMQNSPHAILRLLNFADVPRRICLLCQRQFKSPEILARHAVESPLHQTNLDDEAMCRAGAARVIANASHSKENETVAASIPVATEKAAVPSTTDYAPVRPALRSMGWNMDSTSSMVSWAASQPLAPMSSMGPLRPMTPL